MKLDLDDVSRLITGYGVFEATTENAIKVLREAMDNYGKPESILTDRELSSTLQEERRKLKECLNSRNSF